MRSLHQNNVADKYHIYYKILIYYNHQNYTADILIRAVDDLQALVAPRLVWVDGRAVRVHEDVYPGRAVVAHVGRRREVTLNAMLVDRVQVELEVRHVPTVVQCHC